MHGGEEKGVWAAVASLRSAPMHAPERAPRFGNLLKRASFAVVGHRQPGPAVAVPGLSYRLRRCRSVGKQMTQCAASPPPALRARRALCARRMGTRPAILLPIYRQQPPGANHTGPGPAGTAAPTKVKGAVRRGWEAAPYAERRPGRRDRDEGRGRMLSARSRHRRPCKGAPMCAGRSFGICQTQQVISGNMVIFRNPYQHRRGRVPSV